MNVKDIAQYITAVAGAAAVIGGIIYSTGWVVSKAQAQEIAQEKANVVQQKLLDEQETRAERDLRLSIDVIVLELAYLDDEPDLSERDVRRKEYLNRTMQRLEAELAELEKE